VTAVWNGSGMWPSAGFPTICGAVPSCLFLCCAFLVVLRLFKVIPGLPQVISREGAAGRRFRGNSAYAVEISMSERAADLAEGRGADTCTRFVEGIVRNKRTAPLNETNDDL
jgi:hypothetical protein